MQEPVRKIILAKKLVGRSLRMTLKEDRTAELWGSFMPQRRNISNTVGTDLYSLQAYDVSLDFKDFTPQTVFEKWALAEVTDFDKVPEGMQPFVLEGGLYAVFHYQGRPQDFAPVFRYIFSEWLPQSGYDADSRPHFELLGARYKNGALDSEEDIYIPIRKKE